MKSSLPVGFDFSFYRLSNGVSVCLAVCVYFILFASIQFSVFMLCLDISVFDCFVLFSAVVKTNSSHAKKENTSNDSLQNRTVLNKRSDLNVCMYS